MNNFRLQVDDQPPTPWEPEYVRHGPVVHTAVARVTELRRHFPFGAIRIEREGEDRKPNPVKTTRYQVLVKAGQMEVQDDDGKHVRQLKDAVITTRPIYEHEKEAALKNLRERFPDAVITEVIHG